MSDGVPLSSSMYLRAATKTGLKNPGKHLKKYGNNHKQ
jgi:hypothetical protein